jgi:hypothetical protein
MVSSHEQIKIFGGRSAILVSGCVRAATRPTTFGGPSVQAHHCYARLGDDGRWR